MRIPAILSALLALAGCAAAHSHRNDPIAPPERIDRSAIVPHVDYHVHLLGPYALPLPDPLAPEVAVPPAIQQLLADRARLAGNVSRVTDLDGVFTEDAQLLNAAINPTGWMHEKEWFMRYLNLATRDGRRRYIPNAYAADGSTGYVAGTVRDSASGMHFQNFLLAVRRGSDGRWRIAAESTPRKTPPRYTRPITADRLMEDMQAAGLRRAVVLSEAFWLGNPADRTRRMTPAGVDEAVRLENDWTAEQVARYPGNLVMACAANVLLDIAVTEMARCARMPNVVGMKLNFGDAGFDFHNPEHVERARRVFRAANENRMAIIVHLAPRTFYGPAEVELFLDRIASQAPDVTIQIAHLAGDGPGITSPEALQAFAEARAAGDPRTANLYFDFAGLVHAGITPAQAELMVTRMRQIGMDRILFASDASPGTDANPSAQVHWEMTRNRLPLTDEELRTIALNVAPYLLAPITN